ncbi:DUF5133 domain-containing protein [Streptomyces sp. NPDC001903]|uniref:DUF5133 domain-containing protein n=1 Tax=Streptomyces sp. NPDC001903 TaxID=3364622 RepID=UPI0036C0112C
MPRRSIHDPRCKAGRARALCVATGTTDVHAALIAARHHLPGTGTLDDSVLASS